MSRATEFVNALKRPTIPSSGGGGEDLLHRWLADLEQLRGQIREWLAPVVTAGAARVDDADVSLDEPSVGTYDAPGLRIVLAVEARKKLVFLKPRGIGIVGPTPRGIVRAEGRVDVSCGVAREVLLRFTTPTTIWKSFSGGVERELDTDVFFDLLESVTGVRGA